MKKLIAFAVAALVAGAALAGIGGAAVNVNGDWYKANGWQDGDWSWCTGGDFDDLGNIYSLTLGGQTQFWDGLTGDGVTGGMGYMIDGENAQELKLDWGGTAGNNQLWQTGGQEFATTAIDISGLEAGTEHTLEVWFWGKKGDNTEYDKDGEQNYKATFTKAVPEPATMSLLGLGALAMVLRRKLRK